MTFILIYRETNQVSCEERGEKKNERKDENKKTEKKSKISFYR